MMSMLQHIKTGTAMTAANDPGGTSSTRLTTRQRHLRQESTINNQDFAAILSAAIRSGIEPGASIALSYAERDFGDK